jgi:tRNA(Ile)-lysidine synthase
MLARFLKYIKTENLFQPGQHILLAISGGVDSVVLAELLKSSGVDFALAHCNFKLRGEESEVDENFVRNLANKLNVKLFCTAFNTSAIANERKTSIQIVARDLRYNWLEKLLESEGFHYLATAHHLNDSIESLIINLINGCGIRGLHGILPKNNQNNRIRPLMFTSKSEILEFAQKEGIVFREDSSNATVKYTRNKIRQQIVPVLEQINPALTETFANNFRHFLEAEWLFEQAIDIYKKELIEVTETGFFKINTAGLKSLPAALTILYEIISPYGFNSKQAEQILEHLDLNSGAIYESENYRLLRSYDFLILQGKFEMKQVDNIFIPEPPKNGFLDLKDSSNNRIIRLSYVNVSDIQTDNSNITFFDAGKLKFPLTLRSWQHADVFQPFGMSGHKKLSKLFKDLKLSRFDREKVRIICSEGQIIWVLGIRTAEQYKVESKSQSIIKMELIKNL